MQARVSFMHYYQFNIGDYARDTGHLTVVEHGIYRLLLDWCYLNEKPITTEQAVRIGRGFPTETQSVLSEFFSETTDGWIHKRVQLEVQSYHRKSETNKRNGAKGGRPKATDNPVGLSSDSESKANQTLTKEPITKEPNTPLTPGGGCARFEEFWAAWPKSERKQDKVKCAKKWKQSGLDGAAESILADIGVKMTTRKWQEGYVEAPLVYLNGRRWEDGVSADGPGNDVPAAFLGAI